MPTNLYLSKKFISELNGNISLVLGMRITDKCMRPDFVQNWIEVRGLTYADKDRSFQGHKHHKQ